MRRIQKAFIGMFLCGVLLGGIGSGIAFVEYSSFGYAGEKQMGRENLVTREFDYTFDPSLGKVAVSSYYDMGSRFGDKILESDETIPEGVIRYEVTFNEKTIRPYLIYNENDEPEPLIEEKDAVGAEHTEPQPQGPGQKEHLQGSLWLDASYIDNGFNTWMECKDELLADLKQKKISDYRMSYITDIRIKVNPATLPYLVDQTW